jgi:hypothetical protein
MPFQKGNKVNEKPICWTVNERGCWICTSHSKNIGGYPQKSINGKKQLISHIFYEKYKGSIPHGLCVLHTCDTPACINPGHLWLGTNADNVQDKVKKRRSTYGEKHPMVKLTESQVLEIRSVSDTQREIAKKYGIAQNTVSYIKNYRLWKHVA